MSGTPFEGSSRSFWPWEGSRKMVRAEGAPLSLGGKHGDQLQKRQIRWGMMMAAAALAIAGCVLAAGNMGNSVGEVTLFDAAKRKLTPEEKKFVKQATSTPDKDLVKDGKFAAKEGKDDMNKFFDSIGNQLKEKDAKAHNHIVQMKKHASTTAAKRDITSYFDRMQDSVSEINAAEHKKQAGTGKASLEKINSYFDDLSAKQAQKNKEDELRLSGVKHHARVAKPEQNPLAPVQGEMPKGAESTKQAESDMDSYFDNLQKAQSGINEGDRAKLAGGETGAKVDTRMSAQASQNDMDAYFDHIKAKVASRDGSDVERLRKDSAAANAHDGVRVAMAAERERKHKISQLKIVHAQKRVIARRQARGRVQQPAPK